MAEEKPDIRPYKSIRMTIIGCGSVRVDQGKSNSFPLVSKEYEIAYKRREMLRKKGAHFEFGITSSYATALTTVRITSALRKVQIKEVPQLGEVTTTITSDDQGHMDQVLSRHPSAPLQVRFGLASTLEAQVMESIGNVAWNRVYLEARLADARNVIVVCHDIFAQAMLWEATYYKSTLRSSFADHVWNYCDGFEVEVYEAGQIHSITPLPPIK